VQASHRFLEGRVALISGAGRGCGEAVALALAAAGAKVCASDINPDRANRVAEQIRTSGGEAFGWQTDVSNKLQVGTLIETVRDRFTRLDIVVNHAHVNPRAPLLTLDEWEWRRTLDVNLTGAFFVAQLAARVMSDEGGGTILLLLKSIPEELAGSGWGAQAASTAGLISLANALDIDNKDRGVHVEAVESDNPDATAMKVVDRLKQAA